MPGYALAVIFAALLTDFWNEHRAEVCVIGALILAGIFSLVWSYQ